MNVSKNRLTLAISLTAIFLLTILFSFVYSSKKQERGEKVTKPEQKITLKEEPEYLKPKVVAEDKTENIDIQFFPKTGEYMVFINADNLEDYRAKKTKAESMLKETGVQDLCSNKVRWPTPSALKDKITLQDTVATGCPTT